MPSLRGTTFSTVSPLIALGLTTVLVWLAGAAVSAQVSASMHMSVSPDGDEIETVRSGTAKVFAVIQYEDATETKLTIRVFGPGGVVVFERTKTYNDSGSDNVEITGQDILAGYLSAATEESADLEDAVDLAKDASSASTKRVRTSAAVAIARTLGIILQILGSYPLESNTLEQLDTARDLVDQVETKGTSIMTDVPDDELDSEIAELGELATSAVDAADLAVDSVDSSGEWALLDAQYTSSLLRDGQVSVGFDWEVNSDGTPGTPAAQPSPATSQPTATPVTPTETREPTATPTTRPATATTQPTSVPTRPATATPVTSSRQQPAPTATTQPTLVVTVAPTPVDEQQAPAAGQPAPTTLSEPTIVAEAAQPAQATPATVDGQSGYPGPQAAETDNTPTPAAQVLSRSDIQPELDAAANTSEMRTVGAPSETPLAPQEERQLPIVRISAILSAIALGLVALWLRARV